MKGGPLSDSGAAPVLWLALGVFAASVAGCAVMLLLGARNADVPLPTAGGEIMHMPLARPSAAAGP
jgi:formate-dependent nitrite reductase membrane component NrfD